MELNLYWFKKLLKIKFLYLGLEPIKFQSFFNKISVMSKIVIFLVMMLFLNTQNYSQTTFSKKYSDTIMQDIFFSGLIHYKDTIYALVWVKNKTEVWKLDVNGNVIIKRKFLWLNQFLASSSGDKCMILDTKGDILVTGVYDNKHGLLKLNRDLDSLWFRSYGLNEATFVTAESLTESNDYIVLQGQAQYNFSPVFVAHLIWLDKEGNLDTMIVHKEVNEIGNIKQGRIKTDQDDNVVFVYGRLFHDPDFPLWSEVYKGILKYDKKKNVIWEWESQELISEDISGDFVFTSQGDIIFIDKGGESSSSKTTFLTCLSKDKSILWRKEISRSKGHGKRITGIENINNDEIIVYGLHSFSDNTSLLSQHGFVTSFSEDGQSLWERTYMLFMGKEFNDQMFPPKYFSLFSLYNCITFDNNQNIFLGGMNTMVYPESGQDDALLVKIDKDGCLNKDLCNEINETDPIDFIRFYDQIPNLQKSIIYGSKNTDGIWFRYRQTFGKDTFAADTRFGLFLFREVWYENLQTGEKSRDFRRVRYWHPEGKVSFATKNNPNPDHLLWTFQNLYDFTLETGDIFELPDSFGMATVISTDTFYLKDGAIRKRITLRHNDKTFHQEHGELIWVEGIGNIKGSFFYQDDWKSGQTTELLCYFDRDQKRYYSPNSVDCLLSSTNDENQDFSLIVFPNPGYHQISYISVQKLSKIEIADITGRLLLSQNQDSGEVDVSFLPAGVYFLHFYTKNDRFIAKKIVKL
jgi:hypothetical protein